MNRMNSQSYYKLNIVDDDNTIQHTATATAAAKQEQ